MSSTENITDKFRNCCFSLSTEDIAKFDVEDNGPINNVVIGISAECYGVRLLDDRHGLSAQMFYINGKLRLRGDIITINIYDPDYFALLIRFCMLLADDYGVDALAAFNTFQLKLRGFLEKYGYFTITDADVEPFKGQDGIMAAFGHKGIVRIPLLFHKKFYRELFDNNAEEPVVKGASYVYLMVNCHTGLIKIGKSINPVYRERTLHSKEPTVHRIAMWRCDESIEKVLHNTYREKRVRGEWFRLLIIDLNNIREFMKEQVVGAAAAH